MQKLIRLVIGKRVFNLELKKRQDVHKIVQTSLSRNSKIRKKYCYFLGNIVFRGTITKHLSSKNLHNQHL
jgi:hypothetical protein